MNHNYSITIITAFIVILFISCSRNPEIVKDIDGNVYQTVNIGDQIWMVENLKVTKFRNGDPIPNVTDSSMWSLLESAAYCNYNNDTALGNEYGRLYNWYAVADARNLAPEGWHIPTAEEIRKLYEYLGGDIVAAGKMKEPGSKHWVHPNIWASNLSGFNALPGGYRFTNTASEHEQGGTFHTMGSNGYWWTTTTSFEIYASSARIYTGFANVDRDLRNKAFGFSVRCIKDKK